MRHNFRIENTINAFHLGTHVHLAAGTNYSTDNATLAKFLSVYPGAKYLGSEAIPQEPVLVGQYAPCPAPVTVASGSTVATLDKAKRQ